MQQAARLDCPGFDFLSWFENVFSPAGINIGWGEIAQALVVAVVVVVVDEGGHGFLERPGQVVILEQDAVFQGLLPALDLALCLRMPGSTADMVHALVGGPIGQLAGDAAAAIVAEQPGPAGDRGLPQPEVTRASSSVAVTSDAFIVVQSR